MGSGGHFSGISKTVKASQGIFRSALQKKNETTREPPKVRNVFISFHVEDTPQVTLLRTQAKDADFGMEFRDYSVKEPFDEQWKRNCAEKISQTSLTICMIGPETASRPAVDWELEESYRQGHMVIGVRIYRDQNHPIPNALKLHNAPIINWDRNDLNSYLRRE